MTAPDRIALRWELGAAVTSGPLMDHPDYTQYVRADHTRAPLAEALAVPEVAALVDAAEGLSAILDKHETKGPLPDIAMMLCWLAAQNVRAALRAIGEGADG